VEEVEVLVSRRPKGVHRIIPGGVFGSARQNGMNLYLDCLYKQSRRGGVLDSEEADTWGRRAVLHEAQHIADEQSPDRRARSMLANVISGQATAAITAAEIMLIPSSGSLPADIAIKGSLGALTIAVGSALGYLLNPAERRAYSFSRRHLYNPKFKDLIKIREKQ
jgi:hypothetical protein